MKITRRAKSALIRGSLVLGVGSLGFILFPIDCVPDWIKVVACLMSMLMLFMGGIVLFGEPLPPVEGTRCEHCGDEATRAVNRFNGTPSMMNTPTPLYLCDECEWHYSNPVESVLQRTRRHP